MIDEAWKLLSSRSVKGSAWRVTEFVKQDFPLASKGCIQKILLYVAGLSIYNYIIIWFEKAKVSYFLSFSP